jgi:hypothetical protein
VAFSGSIGLRHDNDHELTKDRAVVTTHDVVVVGAGPYGLAAAAHIRSTGLDAHVLGEPMVFWKKNMPTRMLLRSPWSASHISDPDGTSTLDAYESAVGVELSRPIPLGDFIAYGQWFQRRVAPDVDRRRAVEVHPAEDGFRVRLEDGETLRTRRVVVAAGIGTFPRRPAVFTSTPQHLASHASEHSDLGRFAGCEVLVVGGGQSALESAALLNEVGAKVEVVVRAGQIHWLVRSARLHGIQRLRPLLYAPSDVGPAGVSWLVHVPGAFRRIPRRAQDPLARRSIRPAGAGWLVPRLEHVPIRLGTAVMQADVVGERLRVRLSDGRERFVDHVLLGTGYRVDVTRYEFLSPAIIAALVRVDGYPRLSPGYESSVPGLHFIGAPAAWSFGPLSRFVAGSGHAARCLTRTIRGSGVTRPHARRAAIRTDPEVAADAHRAA